MSSHDLEILQKATAMGVCGCFSFLEKDAAAQPLKPAEPALSKAPEVDPEDVESWVVGVQGAETHVESNRIGLFLVVQIGENRGKQGKTWNNMEKHGKTMVRARFRTVLRPLAGVTDISPEGDGRLLLREPEGLPQEGCPADGAEAMGVDLALNDLKRWTLLYPSLPVTVYNPL